MKSDHEAQQLELTQTRSAEIMVTNKVASEQSEEIKRQLAEINRLKGELDRQRNHNFSQQISQMIFLASIEPNN